MIRDPAIREAKALLDAHNREQRKAKADERKARQRTREQRVDHKPAKPNRGREKDKGYLAFLRLQPCAARRLGGCEGRIEAAHLRFNAPGRPNPGLQRKNHDRFCNPLCTKHHAEQHKGSEQAFWARVGVDPAANAAALFAVYSGNAAPDPKMNGEVVAR